MNTFVDTFLFIDLCIVITLCFTDFLIGKDGRQKMRDDAADLWVYLKVSSAKTLIQDFSGSAANFLYRVFGKGFRPKIFNLFIYTFCAMLMVSWLYIVIIYNSEEEVSLWEIFRLHFWGGELLKLLQLTLFLTPFSALIDYVSVLLSGAIFQSMKTDGGWLKVILFILLFVVFAITLAILTLGAWALAFGSFDIQIDIIPDWLISSLGLQIYMMPFLLCGTALVPPCLHIVLSLMLLFLKLTHRLIQPFITLLLERLVESEKGILSVVAVSIGAVAKLVQSGVKLL